MNSLSQPVKQFIGGAFGLIALYLLLSHASGFSRAVTAIGQSSSGVFKTLQARP